MRFRCRNGLVFQRLEDGAVELAHEHQLREPIGTFSAEEWEQIVLVMSATDEESST